MLVSAIMPTRGRSWCAHDALKCWESQTHKNRELVIIDDMDCPSFPGGLSRQGIQYFMLRQRLTIGEKRNLACSRAKGEIICHFDDDDWSHRERIEDQLTLIDQKPVVGYSTMIFLSNNGERYEYGGYDGQIIGTSLMYRRDWWIDHPFTPTNEGEDVTFVNIARGLRQALAVPANGMMRATIHDQNTSKRELHLPPWRRIA